MFVTNCHATPYQTWRSVDAAVRRAVGTLLVAGGTSLVAFSALAQTSSPPSEAAPSERAKRDADKVFHWIQIQGDRTRKAPAAAAKDAVKDAKDAREERTAAKPARVAAPDVAAARPKGDAAVATAEPANALTQPAAKLSGTPAPKRAEASAPLAALPVAHAPTPTPTPEDARLARAEHAPRAEVPPVEVSDDAPQGLVALAQPAPQFPINVMRTLRRGTVQVRFNVLTDGSVGNLEVLNTTNARLNAAALEAIGQWRFQPLSKMQTGAVEVGFNLE